MSEIKTPAGLEPTPGVDTTREGLARKYKQEVPKDLKPVLGPEGTAALEAKQEEATAAPVQKPKPKRKPSKKAEAPKAEPKGKAAAKKGGKKK